MPYVIFPLGNSLPEYAKTRHNTARIVLAKALEDKEFQTFLDEKGVEIFIPEQTFMNDSGVALKKFLKGKNLATQNIIILYDEKDFALGKVRTAYAKSAGGHKGLEDIIDKLESRDFYRIRIGIAPMGVGENGVIPPHGQAVRDYVLAKLSSQEINVLESAEVIEQVKAHLREILK